MRVRLGWFEATHFFNASNFSYQQSSEFNEFIMQSWNSIASGLPENQRAGINVIESGHVFWNAHRAPFVESSAEIIIAPMNGLVPDNGKVFLSVIKITRGEDIRPIVPPHTHVLDLDEEETDLESAIEGI